MEARQPKRSRSSDLVVSLGGSATRKRQFGGLVSLEEYAKDMPLLSNAACGRGLCIAIGVDDRVYIWGKSSLPDAQVSEIFFPTRLENLGSDGTKTVGVACGNFHALALTEDGTVWAWGSNARGRLGVSKGVASHEFRPVQIPLLSFRHRRVVSIGCGLHHSVFLLEDGQVFAAGCNENGQQGREAQFRQVSSHDPAPVDLPDGVRICRIASGRHHIIALSTENELFGWGKNENGQIGIPGGQDSARPVRIRHERWLETKIKMFDCGRNHTVVAMTNDTLWAFGQNVDGQLGVQSREDKSAPEQLQIFNGVSIRQISCGSRQTSIITSSGKIWSWGYLLVQKNDRSGPEFRVNAPMLYSDSFELPSPLSALHAGSTHTLLSMEDGSVAVYGENLDNVLVQFNKEMVLPPAVVKTENGENFRIRQRLATAPAPRTCLAQHLLMVLRSELDANFVLKSQSGTSYHLHRVVLAARAPNLLIKGKVKIPDSQLACKQLFEWIYTRECDLSELDALEVVQMLETVHQCAPCLGQLHSRLEQRFVHLITMDKDENLLVAENASFLESTNPHLVQWVKYSLADHVARREMNEQDLSRLPKSLLETLLIVSHEPRSRPQVPVREESTLESCFVSMLQATDAQGSDSDFEIRFENEPSLFVHGCFISRCAFFEAFLRNLNSAQGRVFVSKTPRSAMLALLRYLYGGELSFSPWDALFLMSPENGVGFYFAANMEHSQEVDLIFNAMHLAISQMPISDSVNALLKARSLGIVTAEAALVDLMADNYESVEHLLESLRSMFGDALVLEIQRSIIYSLLAKNQMSAGAADTTMNDVE